MKISEVKKVIKNKSFEKFRDLNFKKYQYGIEKKIGDYEFYIGFGIVDSDNSFPTTFHYGISSKHLNNILMQIFPNKGLKINSYVTVYGTKQTRLYENNEYPILEYNIRMEEDIDKFVNDLYKYYTEKALPFLEKLMNIQELSSFINSDKVLSESMHLPTTLVNGLIILKLANDNHYIEFKNRYKELVREWTECDKSSLEEVINFLDRHNSQELLKIAEG